MSMPRIYGGRRKKLLWLLIANGCGQALCGLGLGYLLREALSASRQGRSLGTIAIAIASLGLLILGLRAREASDSERLGQDYVTRVRLRIFDRLAASPGRGGVARRWGVTMTRMISDLNSLRNWVSTGIARATVASITLIVLLLGLGFFSALAALIVSLMVVVCLVGTAWLTPSLRSRVRETRRRRGRLANNLSEKILAVRTLRQLGLVRRERSRVRRHSIRLADSLARRVQIGSILRSLPDATMPLVIAGLAFFASRTAAGPHELVITILLLGMITAALRDLARAWDHRLAFEEGRRRIGELLSGPRLRESRQAVDIPGEGPVSLRFNGVCAAGVLTNIDHEVAAGEQVLVVGPSGSGKSTLLALATRMFDPEVGQVLIDGIPIDALRLDALRGAVQLVSPDLPLLRGSVADNLGYGLTGSDADWMDRVAEICGLGESSPILPQGLETRVDEQGHNLPAGVRARITLARALIVRPRLLLVDDASFSTDREAARALEQANRLWPMTTLVVGSELHDPTATQRVWVLPAGSTSPP